MSSLLKIHLAVLLFGMAGLFGRILIISATTIVFGRVFFASLALLFILKIRHVKLHIELKADKLLTVSLGVLLAFHWIAFFKAIQLSNVAIGLLTFSTFPVFTVLLEPFFFIKRFSIIDLIWALLALAGIYLIIPEFNFADQSFWGAMWGILSGLSFSFLSLFNKRLVIKNEALKIAFWQDLTACLILFFPALAEIRLLTISEMASLLLLGTVFTAVAHTLFISGMKTVSAAKASIIATLEPVYGIILAFFLLAEVPGYKVLLGGGLILSAVVLAGINKKPGFLRETN